jgi:dTDP-4-amino-4,6-dideoxygalactose transaminase
LTPLRSSEFDIHFYKITPELEPDISDLEGISRTCGPPDMMIFVHYFGISLNMEDTEEWCRGKGVILIEDAAHSLLPVPGIGDHGYHVLYTPWKFLNTPDGGTLLVIPEGSEIDVATSKRDEPFPWTWALKRIASTAATELHLPVHKLRKIRVKEYGESEPPADPGTADYGSRSASLISGKESELPKIGLSRERNYRTLDEAISNSSARIHRIFQNLPGHFTPYVYPLRIKGEACRDIMVALNKIGIPAQPWSDLSPEVKDSKEYPLSNALRREVMVLPVHQDLKLSQVKWMTQEVIKHISRH